MHTKSNVPAKNSAHQPYQYRLCFYVPLRVREFFNTEPKERTVQEGMRWTQGRLLTELVDMYRRQSAATASH